MADGSWDNGGHGVPAKAGLPLWGKIALGCGIAFLVVLVTCVGAIAWGFNKVSSRSHEQWPLYVDTVKALKDPSATKVLYETNPRLKLQFSDSVTFENQVAEWRPALQTPPNAMPALTSGRIVSFVGKNTSFGNSDKKGNHEGAVTAYKMDDGRFLAIVWEDGQMAEIRFDGHPTTRIHSNSR